MAGNVFILVGCGLMAWLLYRFKLSKAVSRGDVRKLLPFFFVFAVFFVFNALFAFMGRNDLNMVIKMTPITLPAGLEDAGTGTGVILDGVVSAKNPTFYWEYVAYIDDTARWYPDELLIDLKDGVVPIGNDTYAARNWPVGERSISYLKANQPVIVIGSVERSVSSFDKKNRQAHLSIHADIIYAGEHADFIASAKRKILLPTCLLAANVIAAVVALVVPCILWLKRK